MDAIKELRAILAESDVMLEPGEWSWRVNEGPDGHWTNTFTVYGPEGEDIAEFDYRPQAELLVVAHNHLGALLDVVEAADEFWVGANEVMTTSHHDDIGDSYDALHAALVHLNDRLT